MKDFIYQNAVAIVSAISTGLLGVITKAHWSDLVAGVEWIRSRGGFGYFLWTTLIYNPSNHSEILNSSPANPPTKVEYTPAQLSEIAAHPGNNQHDIIDLAAIAKEQQKA